ncbi:MAG: hypothetical protein RJA09_426, partial [Pseudomonadota bacterium]
QAAVGQEVVVRGMWAGGALAVSDAEVQPTSGAVNGAARVVLQGFVQATRSNGMDMGYASVEWSPGIESVGGRLSQLLPGQLVVVSGRWGPDRRVLADRIEWRRLGGRGTTAPSDDNARGRSGDDGASGGGDSSGQGRGRGRGRGRSGG